MCLRVIIATLIIVLATLSTATESPDAVVVEGLLAQLSDAPVVKTADVSQPKTATDSALPETEVQTFVGTDVCTTTCTGSPLATTEIKECTGGAFSIAATKDWENAMMMIDERDDDDSDDDDGSDDDDMVVVVSGVNGEGDEDSDGGVPAIYKFVSPPDLSGDTCDNEDEVHYLPSFQSELQTLDGGNADCFGVGHNIKIYASLEAAYTKHANHAVSGGKSTSTYGTDDLQGGTGWMYYNDLDDCRKACGEKADCQGFVDNREYTASDGTSTPYCKFKADLSGIYEKSTKDTHVINDGHTSFTEYTCHD